jgi:glucose/arabinose dehydrogenase
MTGFLVTAGGRNADGSLAPITQWGRPVGLTMAPDGSLLVSDDQGGRIWQKPAALIVKVKLARRRWRCSCKLKRR